MFLIIFSNLYLWMILLCTIKWISTFPFVLFILLMPMYKLIVIWKIICTQWASDCIWCFPFQQMILLHYVCPDWPWDEWMNELQFYFCFGVTQTIFICSEIPTDNEKNKFSVLILSDSLAQYWYWCCECRLGFLIWRIRRGKWRWGEN